VAVVARALHGQDTAAAFKKQAAPGSSGTRL